MLNAVGLEECRDGEVERAEGTGSFYPSSLEYERRRRVQGLELTRKQDRGNMRMRKRRKDERGSSRWCPKHVRLLRSLSGERLRSLVDLLHDLLRQKSGLEEDIGLVRDGDPQEYLTLLNYSFAVLSTGAPERVGRVPVVQEEPTHQRWSQQQVVERAIQVHLREGASSNILCFGYGQVQSSGPNKEISASKGPEYHHLNVATGFISTHLWVTLLSRVGEERMLYLLSYASIFVPLPNFCLLQVAGHPYSMAAPCRKRMFQDITTAGRNQCELPTVLQQEASRIEQNTPVETNEERQPCDDVLEDVTRSRKRVRPSSWVRRKQRGGQGSQKTAVGQDTIDLVIASPRFVNKMDVRMPCSRVDRPPRSVDRSSIFYHSSFSCHAGLPANHILNTTNVNDQDASRLLGSMFNALDIADTTSGEASTSKQGNTIKGKLIEDIKGLLKKMIRSAKNCKYARLLSRHCPLPSYLSSPLPNVKTSRLKPKTKVSPNAEGLSLLKEVYATQEVIELECALPSPQTAEFQDVPAASCYPDLACKQQTQNRLKREFHTAGINALGSSKKICNLTRSSKPLNTGDHSVEKVICTENLQKPWVVDEETRKNSEPTSDLATLVTLSTSHSQVVNFLWATCRCLLPEEFLGSQRFRRMLCSGIASFVGLRRYETFHVEPLLNKLQNITGLWPDFHCKDGKSRKNFSQEYDSPVAHTNKREPGYLRDLCRTLLEDWLYWLFAEVIVSLLRSHFYVTEAENHRQNVLYYRKPVWAKIHMLSLKHLVEKCYSRLDPATVAAVLQKRVLGFSHIRMLPKYNGVRPIANLSSRTRCTLPLGTGASINSAPCGKRSHLDAVDYEADVRHSRKISREIKFAFKSINSRLRGVHTCLKFEQENHSEDMGASVFGYKDAYIKFLPFVMHLKSLPGGMPPMYMAVCDISRAYDTIKQDKLCEVVAAFLRLPVYHIRRYVSIFNTMGCARASYKQTCTASDRESDMLNFFMDLTSKRSHCILQDQGLVTRVKQGHILKLIEDHVKRNIVKIGPHFYLQKSGIAQGSVLSPFLCSVFFGHLDEHILMPLLLRIPHSASGLRNFDHQSVEAPRILDTGETVLLRLIDDSLLISTSQSCVARFVQLMHGGFEEYGCHANQQKTAVSFDLLLDKNHGKLARGVYMTSDGASFMRWSGLLINCCTLEVQADYTRYIGDPIKGSITVLRRTNPGAQVPVKLCHFVRAKCHPMLYDLRINSPSTIRLNAFQAFLLCAMKFHAYLCGMGPACNHHSPFLLKAIEVTPSYMHGLLRKQMQEVGDSVHLGVTKAEMTWLALHAFRKVLNKKQSRYAELLFLIQERLDLPKYEPFSQCPHLASARDESRSTMFKFIIY